jgi:hypothetical protein
MVRPGGCRDRGGRMPASALRDIADLTEHAPNYLLPPAEAGRAPSQPILGTFACRCASANVPVAKRKGVTSHTGFLFMVLGALHVSY